MRETPETDKIAAQAKPAAKIDELLQSSVRMGWSIEIFMILPTSIEDRLSLQKLPLMAAFP